ncbi:hypothetical protein [Streptomyces sp. NPDC053048]|uniref:hypothetical protein n=1 Tax=Streptomyces sp. NPDC053048 TaxID=3365694 RepID=UPI0037D35FDB
MWFPLPGAEPTEQDVAALIGIFRERGLLPRLEFAPQAAPAVAPALRAAGFGTEAVPSNPDDTNPLRGGPLPLSHETLDGHRPRRLPCTCATCS